MAALPIVLWIVSGLFMAARPIEEVRGEDLRRSAVPVRAAGLTFPTLTGTVAKVALIDQAGRPVWIVTTADKSVRRFEARTGAMIAGVDEAEARRIAQSVFAGKAALQTVIHFAGDKAPLDLRKPRPSWQATFGDGTHLYIDADSGEVMALRTRWWRANDLLWGLYIMDLKNREHAHNPWVNRAGQHGTGFVNAGRGAAVSAAAAHLIRRDRIPHASLPGRE